METNRKNQSGPAETVRQGKLGGLVVVGETCGESRTTLECQPRVAISRMSGSKSPCRGLTLPESNQQCLIPAAAAAGTVHNIKKRNLHVLQFSPFAGGHKRNVQVLVQTFQEL